MTVIPKEEWLYYRPVTTQRLIMVAVAFLSSATPVQVTGGFTSPLKILMLLPVFLSTLLFDLAGGVIVALIVCLYGAYLYSHATDTVPSAPYATANAWAFLLTALIIGLFSARILRRLRQALQSAEQAKERALRAEWLTDTALMMQSMPGLEQTLSVALIRLDEMIPFDSVAVFLREGDSADADLHLVQTMSLPPERIGVTVLSSEDQKVFNSREKSILSSHAINLDSYRYTEIDRAAKSWVVVPLCTLDQIIGVLYVASKTDSGFTPQEQADLFQFAAHILYPIQRVRLQAIATTDLLTGLGNRRAFWHHLRHETERIRRYMHTLSLLMIDIDYFKNINDTYGHLSGDTILTQLGQIIRNTIRESDYGIRYGGEELAIICPETSGEEAVRFAERLRRIVEETDFRAVDGTPISLTISVGIATMPQDVSDPEGLVDSADKALYAAKASGRNRVSAALEQQTA